jgi:hypothetical protein
VRQRLGTAFQKLIRMDTPLTAEAGQSIESDLTGTRFQAEAAKEISDLLKLLPDDVLAELKVGTIDPHDSAFLEGLSDHVARLTLASPSLGSRLLGKLNKVKKLIRRSLHESNPDEKTSNTISRDGPHVGRNAPCPCGSGRKFKQCCLRRG